MELTTESVAIEALLGEFSLGEEVLEADSPPVVSPKRSFCMALLRGTRHGTQEPTEGFLGGQPGVALLGHSFAGILSCGVDPPFVTEPLVTERLLGQKLPDESTVPGKSLLSAHVVFVVCTCGVHAPRLQNGSCAERPPQPIGFVGARPCCRGALPFRGSRRQTRLFRQNAG